MRELQSKQWMNENRLQPAEFKATGRGVFSKCPINTDEPLIELPFDALISLATLEKDDNFKALFQPAFETLKGKISTQCLLAVYILFRKHQHPSDPYILSIPEAFCQPFFCTKQELMILPDHLFERIHEQSQQITVNLNLLTAAIGVAKCDCCSAQYFPDIFTSAAFKWAFFAVNSRSVFIDPTNVKRVCPSTDFLRILRDSPNAALAPFLDLLNHSDRITPSEPEFFVPRGSTDTSRLTYNLNATQTFRPYEQVFISYGTLDNAKLLLEYGFMLPDNLHDCVRLDMKDVAAFLEMTARQRKPINSNKFKFIKENQLDAEMFVCRADGLSHNLLVVLTILFVDVAHFNNTLSIVGFGDVQPLEPVADVARQLLAFKRGKFEGVRKAFEGIGDEENRSASGAMVVEYLDECVAVIDDVLRTYLEE